MEEGKKDLGKKVSGFLVEEGSPVAMTGKSSCVLLPAKRCRQRPTAKPESWNGREFPIPSGHNIPSLLFCFSWQPNFITPANSHRSSS